MPTLCECDLSIIIPVYNLEKFITPMLICLKDQKLGDYKVEILFINNNCTDRTEEVIRNSGLDCKILYCEKQGCGCARNVGIENAKGNYIWFLDGDDWLLSDVAIKYLLDAAYQTGFDVIYVPFISETFTWQYFSMCPQYFMRREFVQEFRFPEYQPAEDDAYMEQVLNKCGLNRWTYMRLPQFTVPLYYYNYGRPGSNMMRYQAGEKI